MAKQLNVNLAFTADTGKARAQLQELQNILSNLGTSAAKGSSIGITKDLGEAISKATELQAILSKSTTKTGGLDIGKFNQALKQGKTSLKSYADSLSQLGPQGEQAFVQLARAINSAEVPLKKTNAMIDEMMTTLKNTARWQISSSILHGFMGTIQQAYGYTKDLNESLNNIRIVTGYSTDEMASFAKEANRAAKALSTSTTDYTNASLIYYQQGLSESEVKERTDITIKMANVARQSAEVVSDQMTAVWNNFTKSSDASLEHYADVMTALGAATASSTDEIAGGLEKFASIADMIGLSYEYAASALATITATTRQSEDVVGTALKTIFARIQGLSLGETLEDGTNLNKYSEALEKVGISIFEQNGELKDMDKILNDMGSKWNTISKDQQVALAQTVAGVRQYNQLVSLMDNWETFEMNLDIANTSEGALDEQAEIYAESWEAARDRVSAAAEGIYDSLINDDFFIGVDNVLTPILESIESIIDAFGGMSGIIGVVGTMLFKYFGDDFAQSIDDTVYNIKLTSKEGFNEILNLRKEANKQMGETMANSSSNTGEGIAFGTIQEAYQIEKNLSDEVLLKKQQLTVEEKKISDLAEKTLQLKMDNLRVLSDETIAQSKLADEADRKAKIDAKEFSRKFSKDINKNDFSKETVNASLETAKKQEKEYGALLAIQQKIEKSTDKESVSKFLLAIKEGAKNAAGEFGNLEATLDGILKKAEKSGTSVNDIKDLIDSSIDQVGAEAQETYDQIESMTGRADGARKSLEGIQKSATNAGSAFVATASNMQKMDDAAEDVRKDLENLEDTQITLGDSLTAFGEVAIGTFSLIQSTMGLTETWMDGSLSILDKVIATIPILINLTNLLNTVYTKSNLEKIKGIKLGIKNIFVTTGETVAEGAHDAALGKQNKTLAINNALKKAGLKGGLKTLAVMAAILATMALVTAAIKSYQLAQDNAKNASKYAREAAEEQRQEYERLNQEYTSLKESIADYKSALNGLNELTKGSAEYAAALEEANKKARELIESEGLYGDWSYGANGEILIDQNALNQATENKRMEAAKAETRYYSAEQRASQQEETDIINKTRQNTLKQVGTTYSYGEAIPEYDWVDKQELDTMAKASKEEYALAKDYANAKSENADLTIDSFLEGRDLGEVDTSKIKELANTVAELGDSADGTRAQLQKLNSEQDYLTKGYATSIAKQVIGEKKENGTIDSRILGNLNAENALGALVANNEEYKKRVESDAQKANLTYGEGATNENIKKLLNERTDDQIDVAGNGVLNDKELAQMYAQYVKGWDLDKVTYSGGYGKGTIKNEDNEEVTLNDEQMRKELYSALLADKMVEEAKTEKGQKDLGYENAERIVTNILDNAGDVLSNKIYQKEQVNENGEVVTPQKEYLADNIIDEEVQQVLLNAISNTNQQLLDQQGLDAAKKTLDTTQVQALEFDFSELSPEQVNEARAMGEQLGGEVGEAITKGLLDYEEKQNLYWDKLEEKQKAVLDASASREGIDPKIYERQTKNIMENVEALKDNENAAKALAINNTRMNKGVDTLIKNWKSWNKVLKEGDRTSEEFAKATAEVASCIGDLVGLSDGLEEQISSDFLASEETMGLLERAANADTEAITELGFAVAKDLTANFSAAQETLDAFASGTTVDILGETLNETEFYSRLDAVRTELDSWITQIQQDVADNGQLDMLSDEQMGDFASKLNEMAILTGMSVEEMQGYLNSMGLEANIEETPHEVTSMMPVTQTWARRQPLQKETDSNGFQLIGEEYTTTSEYLPVKETRMIPQIAFSSDGSAKPDKPQISYVGHGNISTGNQTAAKNANKSSGSKPKAAEQKKSKDLTKKDDIIDRYKEINDSIDDLADSLNDASKEEDRLWGKARIDNISKQNKLIQQQIGLTKQKLTQAEGYLGNKDIEGSDWYNLEKAANALGVSAQVENGNIINYTETLEKAFAELEALEKYWANPANFADKDAQDKYEEEKITPIREAIEAYKDAVQQFDDTQKIIQDLENEWQDLINTIQDNNFKKLEYNLEIKLELHDNNLKLIDQYLDNIADDFYNIAEAAELTNTKFNDFAGMLTANQVQQSDLQGAFDAKLISQDQYISGMQTVFDNALQGAADINELNREMFEYYENAFDEANSMIDAHMSKMEHLASVLDHYKNIVTLVGGEFQFDKIDEILQGSIKHSQNTLDSLKATKAMLEGERAEVQAMYDAETNEDLKKKFQKDLDMIDEKIRENNEEILSENENLLEKLREQLDNALAKASYDMEKHFTNGMGFDSLMSSLDRLSTYQDIYLTKTNQLYETDKLIRKAQQDADKTQNEAAKKKLANFQKETKELQEKNEMSHLELEIQQAKYDLLLAEIALEEAQNAKSTVRLQRDNEGNFGYVYTADQNKVSDAEQELADAENRLYNIGLEATNDYGQKILELQQKLSEDLQKLEEDRANGRFATEEEYYRARDQLISEYDNLFRGYSEQYTIAMGAHDEVRKDSWVNAYEEMINQSENWKDYTIDYTEQCENAYDNWRENAVDNNELVQEVLNNTKDSVKDVTDASDDLKDELKDELIPAIKDELQAVREATAGWADQYEQIMEMRDAYMKLAESIREAIEAQANIRDEDSVLDELEDPGEKPTAPENKPAPTPPQKPAEDLNAGKKALASEAAELVTKVHKGQIGNGGAWKKPARDAGYSDEAISLASKVFTDSKPGGGYSYNYQKALELLGVGSYDTGGYTGSWGPDGKLAMLHQKEIVLNAEDTANFLAAIDMVRDIVKIIDIEAMRNSMTNTITPMLGNFNSGETIEQSVHIEASFPAVKDRNEIEEAFNNLVNTASQYANRKTI